MTKLENDLCPYCKKRHQKYLGKDPSERKYVITVDLEIKELLKNLVGKKFRGITLRSQTQIAEIAIEEFVNQVENDENKT